MVKQICPICREEMCCNYKAGSHAIKYNHYGFYGKPKKPIGNKCLKKLSLLN